eukprot:1157716-Pelagomonas_calceolata.AAC.13
MCALREAVQTGQSVRACEILQKRIYAKDPDVCHAQAAAQVACAGVGLSARNKAVPLSRNHNTEALLRHGEQNDWLPVPDEVAALTLAAMQKLVAEQIRKMNGRLWALIVWLLLLSKPFIGRLFKSLYDKACIPDCWKHAKVTPLYKKGTLLDPNSHRMLAVSGTMYRMYANVIHSLGTAWCTASKKIPDTQFGFYPGQNTSAYLYSATPATCSTHTKTGAIQPVAYCIHRLQTSI